MYSGSRIVNRQVRREYLSLKNQKQLTIPTSPVQTILSNNNIILYTPVKEEGSIHWDTHEKKLYISDGTHWIQIHTNPSGISPTFGKVAEFFGDINVTGLIDPTGVVYTEQGSSPAPTPSTGFGTMWVKNTSPTKIFFTNSNGIDIDLTAAGGTQDLATTLTFGNITGGLDIELTSGDSITGSGQVPIISSQASSTALKLEATNILGGIDIDSGTGGISIDTTGSLIINSSDTTNLTMTTNDGGNKELTLSAINTGAGDGIINLTADDVRLTSLSGGGITSASIDNNGSLIRSSFIPPITGTITTTDATVTQILSIPTINSSSNILNIFIAARQTGGVNPAIGSSATWVIKASWKNIGGTMTQLGPDDIIKYGGNPSDPNVSGWVVSTTDTTPNIIINVTGGTGQTIDWIASVTVINV